MRTKKFDVVTCPICGREYLPAEIFVPKYFFGQPENISRNDYGKIENFTGKSMDTSEIYTCDTCSKSFRVQARIQFSCDSLEDTFEEEYTSSLKKEVLFLTEE